jgi:hypothetical protein
MTKDLPYLPTYKNLTELFERIQKAKIPDAFTNRYLSETLGLKSTNDRNLISLLKKLGFLDNSGKPTSEYSALKNKATARAAIDKGIRRAFAPLYEANEAAHELPGEELKGLVAQVSGAEEGMAKLIFGTLNALVKLADFTEADKVSSEETGDGDASVAEVAGRGIKPEKSVPPPPLPKFSPEFKFNIEIHLPSNGTEETYLAIFNALRTALG